MMVFLVSLDRVTLIKIIHLDLYSFNTLQWIIISARKWYHFIWQTQTDNLLQILVIMILQVWEVKMQIIFNGSQCQNKVYFGIIMLMQFSMVTTQKQSEHTMGLHTNSHLMPPCNFLQFLILGQVLSIFLIVLLKISCIGYLMGKIIFNIPVFLL